RQIFKDFKANCSLTGDDFLVIVRRHDHIAMLGSQFFGAQTAFFTAGTDDDDFRSQGGGSVELVLGSVAWHDNNRPHNKRPCRVGHTLRVIAAGIRDHAAAAFVLAQRSDLVVSPAQFESADGLLVFELEEELALIRGAGPFEEGSSDRDASEEGLSGAKIV